MSPQHYLDYEFDVVTGTMQGSGSLVQLTPNSNGISRQNVHYSLDFSPIMVATGQMLSASCADLIEVAFVVRLADRVAPRSMVADPRMPDDRWPRRIHLRLPVWDPDRWQSAMTSGVLGSYLGF